MAVVTSSYRSLNARWLWDLVKKNKSLFIGVSRQSTEQTVTVDGKTLTISNFDVNDNDSDEAIRNCDFFVRAEVEFVKESGSNSGDIQLLTKQIYSSLPYNNVSQHTFQDQRQFWCFITPEIALSENCYNLVLDFMLENQDPEKFSLFKNIRHFYMFDNLLYNGDEVSEDFIEKDSDNNFSAGNIIIIDDFIPLNVQDYFNSKIKYLISF